MSYSPVGDTIAVTKLAYSVYTKVYVVARDAPDRFDEIKTDLKVFKSVLFLVRDFVNRDAGSTCGTDIQDVLCRCRDTLRRLRDIIAKYEKLDWSERGEWIARLKFTTEQGTIKELRDQFSRHQQTLQLFLTVDGRQRLCEDAKQGEENRLRRAQLLDGRSSEPRDARQGSFQTIRRINTETTLGTGRSARDSVSSSSPRIGRRLFSVTGYIGPNDPPQPKRISRSLSISTLPTKCTCESENLESPQLIEAVTELSPDAPTWNGSTIASPTKTKQPLNLSLDREKHNSSPEVHAAFQQSYESEDHGFSTETWLRLAIWWLVKARTMCRSLAVAGIQRRRTDASLYQDGWEVTISDEQAYADLLKGSWILEEVVLAKDNEDDLSYTNIRRLVQVLALSIDRDLRSRRNVESQLPDFDNDKVLQQDLALLEGFEQTIELKENVPGAIDDPASAHRWFEPDQDNAGADLERVMYRTYVNAQLGNRAERSKSSSAPYMLLLWTTADESDLLITLCNQRGTVNLSRKMLAKDLENFGQTDGLLPLAIDFPSQDAEIKFLGPQDLQDFLVRPQLFFAAMKSRAARYGELAIYQAPIAAYCDSTPRAHSTSDTEASIISSKTSACGLTIYEEMPDKCWKTIRRLVIHAAPDSTQPMCASHWLPLDHVRVSVDGLKVTIHWSDCRQLDVIRPGNFEIRYSFVYKAEEPNQKIDLQFRSSDEASRFQECLLYPTDTPAQIDMKRKISSAIQDVRLYRLYDADDQDHQYHGLVLTKTSPKGPYMTEFYYAYRDLDWIIEAKSDAPGVTVRFPQLCYPHYNSTQPNLIYEPGPKDPLPEFKDVVARSRAAKVELGCEHDLIRFMLSLTGWRLKYIRPIAKLVIIEVQVVRDKKDTFQNIDIQLWEKDCEEGKAKTQLAVRFKGDVRNRWMTASLADNDVDCARNTLEIKEVMLQRGIAVDSKDMTAVTAESHDQAVSKKRYKIAMSFLGGIDKEEFQMASGLFSFSQ